MGRCTSPLSSPFLHVPAGEREIDLVLPPTSLIHNPEHNRITIDSNKTDRQLLPRTHYFVTTVDPRGRFFFIFFYPFILKKRSPEVPAA